MIIAALRRKSSPEVKRQRAARRLHLKSRVQKVGCNSDYLHRSNQ